MIKTIKSKMNQKGFSLIELMVVIVIMLILAAIAIPAFLGVIDDSKVSAATFEVRSVLMLAQMEANKTDVDTFLGDATLITSILTEAGVVDEATNYTFAKGTTNGLDEVTVEYSGNGVAIKLPQTYAVDGTHDNFGQ